MTDKAVTTTEVVVEPKSNVVIVDSSNLEAVLADARGEKIPEPKAEEKAAEKPAEVKAAEDDEGEDGLTTDQREDPALTEKMKKTIGKQVRRRKEAEELAESQFNEKQLAIRRTEALERENARLREQLTPPKVEEAPKKPNKADFKTDEDYQEAMVNFRVDEKMRENEEKQRQQAQADRQREMVAEAVSRLAVAKELVTDFAEVVEAADVPVPPNIAGYMQESEMFAELGYHFAKNPEVLENLAKLSPAKQLVAIGKIESTLKPFSDKTEKAEVKVKTGETPESKDGTAEKPTPSTNGKSPSKARLEPMKPLETGSAALVEKPVSDMTFQEYKTHWQKTHKVNLALRKRH